MIIPRTTRALFPTLPLCFVGDSGLDDQKILAQVAIIEHTYSFDQEQGLDGEDMRVDTIERMRRVSVLALLATLFAYCIDQIKPRQAIHWLRQLGGELGLITDADGPQILLASITTVLTALATIGYTQSHPFPRAKEIDG